MTRRGLVRAGGLATALALTALTGLGGQRASAQPVSPLDVIRDSNQRVLEILQASGSGDELDPAAEAELTRIMDAVTDFPALADGALDRLCASMSEAACAEFKAVFSDLLRRTAIRRFGRYRADSFEYREEIIEGDAAVVRTLAHYGDDTVALDYELGLRDGRWQIVNYVVDGIDTVRNYSRQFSRQLRRESPERVIARLRRRVEEVEAEP